MPRYLFPDTSVMRSFAAAGDVALLERYLAGTGRIVEAVASELDAAARYETSLVAIDREGWFGAPIRIEDADEVREVERMRRQRFGGLAREPLRHLGESQTLVILMRDEFSGSVWISDDRGAYGVARNQRIEALHTVEILRQLVADDVLERQRASGIVRSMIGRGRHLIDPPATEGDW